MKSKVPGSVRIFAIVALMLVFAYSLSFNILNVTMSPIVDEFRIEGTSQGLISSMMSLGGILPLFIVPLLQGRVKKYWLILIACLLQVAMLFLTGISQSYGMVLFANLLLGVGYNATDSCVNSYIVDIYPNNAGMMGLLHGIFGVGGLVTPVLFTAILTKSGWRVSYSVAAIIFIAFIAVFAIVGGKRYRTVSANSAPEARFSIRMLREYITSPRNLLILLSSLLCAAGQIGLIGWVVRYVYVRFGEAASTTLGAAGVSAYWICCAVCRLTFPSLPFNRNRMMIIGAVGGGIAHALGVLSGSAIGMVIGCGVNGLLSGLCIPTLISVAAVGNEDRTSLTTSANFLIMAVGRVLIPLAMAAVATWSMTVAMLIPAVCLGVSGLTAAMALRRN